MSNKASRRSSTVKSLQTLIPLLVGDPAPSAPIFVGGKVGKAGTTIGDTLDEPMTTVGATDGEKDAEATDGTPDTVIDDEDSKSTFEG